ncbi:hypothetical protein BBJ28_00017588 [Nothophytophthora sp. Chile5]|nr:hypothetical protein BBJ28_00017588 [Nothophytophthora sp. Chile5]
MATAARRSGKRAGASTVEKIKKKLGKRVAEAVDSVCGELALAMEQAAQPQAPATFDSSYACCKKLVTFIARNMATSPGFEQQMDRIVLACLSGASERVLSDVVTKDVWFRSRDRAGKRRSASAERRATIESSRNIGLQPDRPPVIKSEPTVVAGAIALSKGPLESESREVAGALLARRPRSRTSKKRLSTKRSLQSPPLPTTKRLRLHEEEGSEEKGSGGEKAYVDTDTDEEREDKRAAEHRKTMLQLVDASSRQLSGGGDASGLLTFKEAIGELCYAEQRSSEQTAFFKERLRKSIQFVDALLCRPPAGKVCSRGCKKIRASMCNRPTPCRDQMCRIWHDVEAHTDRCQNAKCEFKLRILVRETMHKLQHKNLELQNTQTKLRKKQAMLAEMEANEMGESDANAESIAGCESEIAALEQDIAVEEAERGEISEALEKFWAILNGIGIELRHDVLDSFPEFATHYAPKRKRK